MKVDIFNQLHEATNNLPAHLYAVDTEDLFIWNLLLLNLDNVYFYCSDKSRVVWDRFGSDLGHASGTPFPNSFQNQQQLCSGFPSGQQWTVLPTAAEPGQFSGEINSSIFWQPERPGGEHSCITGTQTDLSASMLDSHNSKKNKLPKSRTGRLTVTLWVHMSWELCGKYQMIRLSGACTRPAQHKTSVSGPECVLYPFGAEIRDCTKPRSISESTFSHSAHALYFWLPLHAFSPHPSLHFVLWNSLRIDPRLTSHLVPRQIMPRTRSQSEQNRSND